MKDYLSGTFPYALNVKRSGCQAHLVLACVEQEDVQSEVLGSVVGLEWQEDVAGLLAGSHSRVPSVKGPEVLMVDEVSDLPAGLAS